MKHSYTKWKSLLSFETVWIRLGDFMLSEVKQAEKYKHCWASGLHRVEKGPPRARKWGSGY